MLAFCNLFCCSSSNHFTQLISRIVELVTANKTTRFYTLAISSKGCYLIFFSWIFNPSGLKYLPRSHSDTWHLVGLLWTSDGPDAETSIWRHAALVTHRHPRPRRDSNSQSQQRTIADARLRARGLRHRLFYITVFISHNAIQYPVEQYLWRPYSRLSSFIWIQFTASHPAEGTIC